MRAAAACVGYDAVRLVRCVVFSCGFVRWVGCWVLVCAYWLVCMNMFTCIQYVFPISICVRLHFVWQSTWRDQLIALADVQSPPPTESQCQARRGLRTGEAESSPSLWLLGTMAYCSTRKIPRWRLPQTPQKTEQISGLPQILPSASPSAHGPLSLQVRLWGCLVFSSAFGALASSL